MGAPNLGECGGSHKFKPPRRPNTNHERGITLVPMSNLIAKIRHWLHLDKKPKTS
jgi:hypothetical protein